MSETSLKLRVDDSEVAKAAQTLDKLKNSAGSAASAADKLSKTVGSAGPGVSTLEQSFTKLNAAIRGYGTFAVAQEILKTADAATLSAARLSLVVSGVTELARAQDKLFDVSQRTRTAVGATTNLFVSLSRSLNTLGVSQQRVLGVTETINKALAVSGSSAQSASAALIQLGQGFASGTLQGEELRSVLEQTPRLAQAIADGLGVPLGALRKLGSEGKLTALKVFQALEKSAQDIATEFGAIPVAVSGAFQQVQNSFTRLVQIINDVTGATGGLASILTGVSTAISDLANDINAFSKGADDVGVLAEAFYAVYETLKILGANVAFVFKGIGREIGAIAAQAAALARFDFSGAAAIRDAAVSDAKAAAKALSDFEEKVFNERKARRDREREDVKADARRLINEAEGRYPKKPQPEDSKKSKKSEVDKYIEQLEKQLIRTKDLTVEEEALAEIQSGRLGKVNNLQKERILEIARTIDKVKEEQKAEKEAARVASERASLRAREEKAIEEAIAAQQAAFSQSLNKVKDRTKDLEDEERAAQIAKDTNISLAEAIELVAIARLRDIKLNKYIEGSEPYKAVEREIEARLQLLGVIQNSERRKGEEKAAEKTAEAIEREYDRIVQTFTEAMINGGKSFGDYIKNLFKTMILRPIFEPIFGPIAGFFAGLSGPAGAAGFGGGLSGGGGLSSAAGAFSTGKSLWEGFESGFAGVGTAAETLAAKMGFSSFGGSSANAAAIERAAGLGGDYYGATTTNTALSTTGSGGTATVVGSVAQIAAGVAVGVLGGRGISAGYGFGNSGNSTVNAGTAAGAAIGGIFTAGNPIGIAIGSALGGIVGGVVNRAFGRKAPEVVGQSIQGNFSGSGDFSGEAVLSILEKGGWFRSDKRSEQRSAITGDLDKALDEGGKKIAELAKKYGEALGLPVAQLQNVTQSINVKIGENDEDNKKALEDALNQYAEVLLDEFAPALEGLRRSGETTAQVIERVGNNLSQVNDLFDLLGLQLLDTSVAGGAAATKLVDIFGGLSELGKVGGDYYAKYYTEEEKVRNLTESLTEEFGKLGYALPENRQALRDIIEAQSTNTDSGLENVAALLKLTGAFDTLRTMLGDTAEAAKKAAEEEAKKAADKAIAVAKKTSELEIEYLKAIGNETAAVALERERELAALRELDPALVAVQKAIYDATDAAREMERNNRVVSGADSVIGDFLSGTDLINFKAKRIGEILAKGGIESSPIGIISSTRDDIVNLWNSVGTAGREAILDALSLWEDLDELVNGTSRRVAEYRRGTLADSIEQARLARLSPADRISRLKATEARLFGELRTTNDPVGVAEKLQGVILQRLNEEAKLRGDINETEKKDLEAKLAAAQRLRDLSDDIFQFVGSLQFSDLSPLSRKDQVSAAETLFKDTLAKAKAGDKNAQSNLLTNAKSFIEEGNSAFGSGPQAAAIFNSVTGALKEFADSGATLDPQIAAYQSQIDNLPSIEQNTADMLPYLQSIDDILASLFGGQTTSTSTGGTTITMTGTNGVLTGVTTTTSASGNSAGTATTAGGQTNSFNAFLASIVANTAKLADLVTNSNTQIAVLRQGFANMDTRLIAIEGYTREQATRGRMSSPTARV